VKGIEKAATESDLNFKYSRAACGFSARAIRHRNSSRGQGYRMLPSGLCLRIIRQDRTCRLSCEEQEVKISALVIDSTVFDIAITLGD